MLEFGFFKVLSLILNADMLLRVDGTYAAALWFLLMIPALPSFLFDLIMVENY